MRGRSSADTDLPIVMITYVYIYCILRLIISLKNFQVLQVLLQITRVLETLGNLFHISQLITCHTPV